MCAGARRCSRCSSQCSTGISYRRTTTSATRALTDVAGKYQPYNALRQKFWGVYLKQYDTDDTGSILHLELTSMLDSLGSTLPHETVNSFWTWFHKRPHDEALTIGEAIQCLETVLCRV